MNRFKLNEETRMAIKAIMNSDYIFQSMVKYTEKYKSNALVEGNLKELLIKWSNFEKRKLEEVDFSAIIKEFREE